MKPLRATTIKGKIKVLKLLKEKMKEMNTYYLFEKERKHPGFCSALTYMCMEKVTFFSFSPEYLGLRPPRKRHSFSYWYKPYDHVSRINNINRTIKRLEKQI